MYMQARYYDPVIGRFYSNDPLGVRDVHSFNRYAYANNNPYKYVDPDGRAVAAILITSPKPVASPISSGTQTNPTAIDNPFEQGGRTTTPVITAPNITPAGIITAIGIMAGGTPEMIDSVVSLATQGDSNNPADDKVLTKGEIRKLKNSGNDPHSLKPKKHGSRFDLFKDQDGNVIVKPKDGSGEGDPTGINMNDLDKEN